jgi:hypothetical protein
VTAPTLAEFISRADARGLRPRRTGDGYQFLCPVHEADGGKHTPSASANEGEKRELVTYCHSRQCSYNDMLRALDFSTNGNSHHATKRTTKPTALANLQKEDEYRKEVARYLYTYEDGSPAYYAVRLTAPPPQTKTFRLEQPDGTKNIKGVRLVIYRLPAVMEGVHEGRTIYLVEGEKNADSINAIEGNHVATTAPMGAGKWRAEYNEFLRGAIVVIVADKDEPGRKHARDIAALKGIAKSLRVVEAADGCHDATDHLNAGYRLEELVPWPEPPRTSWTHDELMAADLPEVKFLVDGLVVDEGLTTLGAKKKTGKSWLTLSLCQAVAAGEPFMGRKVSRPGRVVYMPLEDGARRLKSRLRMQNARTDLDIIYRTRITPLDDGGFGDIEKIIEKEKPVLLAIDTLAAAKTGKTDENAAGQMADLFNALRVLAQDRHVAIILVVHHGKSTTGDPGHDIRGSSAAPGAADLNLAIYKLPNGNHELRGEGRDIEELALRVAFDVTTFSWKVVGDARALARSEAEQEILDALAELGEANPKRIAAVLEKSRAAVQMVLKRMREQGRIKFREGDSGYLYRA